MTTIIPFLLLYIQVLENTLTLLFILLMRFAPVKPSEQPINKPYNRFQVDPMPIIKVTKVQDYRELLKNHLQQTGKVLTPVKRRKTSSVPEGLICPYCQAPHQYIYDNNGSRGQFQCKVCGSCFAKKRRHPKSISFFCPFCGHTLERKKERKQFNIHKCTNDRCSFYLDNLATLSKKEYQLYQQEPFRFKLRYIYREFTIDFKPLQKTVHMPDVKHLSRIYASPHTLGLILTYNVNFGMSTRNTAALMKEVHGLKISHATVHNYANAASILVKPFVDNFDYKPTSSLCGDETYIKVKGRWHYVYFVMDAIKKNILAYPVSAKRDTLAAISALDSALSKFKEIPDDLNLVFDGNPTYLLAQHFFAQNDIHFDMKQVIGLKNEDQVSFEYRHLKQIIERLNRTFKHNYRPTNGFGSEKGSVAFVTLFVAYFNFLRPHSSLEKQVPALIPELDILPNMPAKWQKLLELSQEYILKHQAAS